MHAGLKAARKDIISTEIKMYSLNSTWNFISKFFVVS